MHKINVSHWEIAAHKNNIAYIFLLTKIKFQRQYKIYQKLYINRCIWDYYISIEALVKCFISCFIGIKIGKDPTCLKKN